MVISSTTFRLTFLSKINVERYGTYGLKNVSWALEESKCKLFTNDWPLTIRGIDAGTHVLRFNESPLDRLAASKSSK